MYSNSDIENTLQGSLIYVDNNEVLETVRRAYNGLEYASDADIKEWFQSLSLDEQSSHVDYIKGLAFEDEVVRTLDTEGGMIFSNMSHPGTDIFLDNGQEFSVKSGTSLVPTREDMYEGLDVISTSEIAWDTGSIDAGYTNTALEFDVLDALI